ncbi:cache domain-containing protein [Roseibium salinum]|nr:cache domain-containing protein [Roseibium salinum]
MTFKTKLLLITILPLIAVSLLIGGATYYQSLELINAQTHSVEQRILSSKRQEIRNYVSLALTSIEQIYNEEPGGREAAQDRVRDILQHLTFDYDGYYFVYTLDGTNIVHPKLPHLVGGNWWDLQDDNGDHVIRNLITAARNGGGFHQYVWNKPSTGTVEEKNSVMQSFWTNGAGCWARGFTPTTSPGKSPRSGPISPEASARRCWSPS